MSKNFSDVLKEARRQKQMTLRELSLITERAVSFLSEIENGIRPVPKDETLLIKIANALGLNSEEVVSNAISEQQNSKRLKNIFFKDPELAACLRRVSSQYSDDAELRAYLKNIFEKG